MTSVLIRSGKEHTEGRQPCDNRGRVSSISGAEKTGQLHAKETNWTTFSHPIQKQIHNELKT